MCQFATMLRDISFLKVIPIFLTAVLICLVSLSPVYAAKMPQLSENIKASVTVQDHATSQVTLGSHEESNSLVKIISNPTIAYLLILLGIYGVFFELLHPGLILPGAVGTASLLLALYAFQLLPINYNGLGLIVLGIAFIISEGYTPSLGILGLAGTLLFVIGSTMLMNSGQTPIAWTVILVMGIMNIILFVFLVGVVVRSRKQKIKNGLVMLLGATGRSLGEINLEGQAVIRGEIWSVHSKSPIKADMPIKVVKASALMLEVIEDHSWE